MLSTFLAFIDDPTIIAAARPGWSLSTDFAPRSPARPSRRASVRRLVARLWSVDGRRRSVLARVPSGERRTTPVTSSEPGLVGTV
jgi:hypothetical protein